MAQGVTQEVGQHLLGGLEVQCLGTFFLSSLYIYYALFITRTWKKIFSPPKFFLSPSWDHFRWTYPPPQQTCPAGLDLPGVGLATPGGCPGALGGPWHHPLPTPDRPCPADPTWYPVQLGRLDCIGRPAKIAAFFQVRYMFCPVVRGTPPGLPASLSDLPRRPCHPGMPAKVPGARG